MKTVVITGSARGLGFEMAKLFKKANYNVVISDLKEENLIKAKEELDKIPNEELRNQIVAYAKQFLGCKYVYGGTTTKGFDCSGFTQYVYKSFGITLNRTAAAQYSNGKSVTNLQAGDLVIVLHVGSHKYFERSGQDLYCAVPILLSPSIKCFPQKRC